jgi:hypothetical protein
MTWILAVLLIIIAVRVVRKGKKLNKRARLTYLLTFFLELPTMPIRGAVGALIGLIPTMFILIPVLFTIYAIALVNAVRTGSGLATLRTLFVAPFAVLAIAGFVMGLCALIAAIGPPLYSLATLTGMHGGYKLTKKAMRARELSGREFKRYEQCVNHLLGLSGGTLHAPTHIFAIKSYEERGFTVGTTMFVTSAALKGKHLLVIIAKEMYMVNSANGSLILALRRFLIPLMYLFGALTFRFAPGGIWAKVGGVLLALAGGGFGVLLSSPLWLKYVREEMYTSDAFVKSLGIGHPLADFLETHEHLDFAVPYFFDPLPDSELRIDRLL